MNFKADLYIMTALGEGQVVSVCLEGGSPFGLRLEGGNGRPISVSKLHRCSKASDAGVMIGDRLLAINDFQCSDHMRLQTANDLLNAIHYTTPLKLLLLRPDPPIGGGYPHSFTPRSLSRPSSAYSSRQSSRSSTPTFDSCSTPIQAEEPAEFLYVMAPSRPATVSSSGDEARRYPVVASSCSAGMYSSAEDQSRTVLATNSNQAESFAEVDFPSSFVSKVEEHYNKTDPEISRHVISETRKEPFGDRVLTKIIREEKSVFEENRGQRRRRSLAQFELSQQLPKDVPSWYSTRRLSQGSIHQNSRSLERPASRLDSRFDKYATFSQTGESSNRATNGEFSRSVSHGDKTDEAEEFTDVEQVSYVASTLRTKRRSRTRRSIYENFQPKIDLNTQPYEVQIEQIQPQQVYMADLQSPDELVVQQNYIQKERLNESYYNNRPNSRNEVSNFNPKVLETEIVLNPSEQYSNSTFSQTQTSYATQTNFDTSNSVHKSRSRPTRRQSADAAITLRPYQLVTPPSINVSQFSGDERSTPDPDGIDTFRQSPIRNPSANFLQANDPRIEQWKNSQQYSNNISSAYSSNNNLPGASDMAKRLLSGEDVHEIVIWASKPDLDEARGRRRRRRYSTSQLPVSHPSGQGYQNMAEGFNDQRTERINLEYDITRANDDVTSDYASNDSTKSTLTVQDSSGSEGNRPMSPINFSPKMQQERPSTPLTVAKFVRTPDDDENLLKENNMKYEVLQTIDAKSVDADGSFSLPTPQTNKVLPQQTLQQPGNLNGLSSENKIPKFRPPPTYAEYQAMRENAKANSANNDSMNYSITKAESKSEKQNESSNIEPAVDPNRKSPSQFIIPQQPPVKSTTTYDVQQIYQPQAQPQPARRHSVSLTIGRLSTPQQNFNEVSRRNGINVHQRQPSAMNPDQMLDNTASNFNHAEIQQRRRHSEQVEGCYDWRSSSGIGSSVGNGSTSNSTVNTPNSFTTSDTQSYQSEQQYQQDSSHVNDVFNYQQRQPANEPTNYNPANRENFQRQHSGPASNFAENKQNYFDSYSNPGRPMSRMAHDDGYRSEAFQTQEVNDAQPSFSINVASSRNVRAEPTINPPPDYNRPRQRFSLDANVNIVTNFRDDNLQRSMNSGQNFEGYNRKEFGNLTSRNDIGQHSGMMSQNHQYKQVSGSQQYGPSNSYQQNYPSDPYRSQGDPSRSPGAHWQPPLSPPNQHPIYNRTQSTQNYSSSSSYQEQYQQKRWQPESPKSPPSNNLYRRPNISHWQRMEDQKLNSPQSSTGLINQPHWPPRDFLQRAQPQPPARRAQADRNVWTPLPVEHLSSDSEGSCSSAKFSQSSGTSSIFSRFSSGNEGSAAKFSGFQSGDTGADRRKNVWSASGSYQRPSSAKASGSSARGSGREAGVRDAGDRYGTSQGSTGRTQGRNSAVGWLGPRHDNIQTNNFSRYGYR